MSANEHPSAMVYYSRILVPTDTCWIDEGPTNSNFTILTFTDTSPQATVDKMESVIRQLYHNIDELRLRYEL